MRILKLFPKKKRKIFAFMDFYLSTLIENMIKFSTIALLYAKF